MYVGLGNNYDVKKCGDCQKELKFIPSFTTWSSKK